MRCQHTPRHLSHLLLFSLLSLPLTVTANVKDISRIPRDNKYYPARTNLSPLTRVIKPEDAPEAYDSTPNPVEKRCTRCDASYSDTRYPYETRTRYDDRRYRPYEYDRYDDRRYDDRRYDDRRYDDRRYDDRRYDDRERYDRYDRRPPTYDRYDRYDRDRYDRYDRDRNYDRDYDRGFGYDNRGYDYRDRGYSDYQGGGGAGGGVSGSGYDGGRGYYQGGGRPEAGAGYWGTGGYASNWNYGGGGGRDEGRDRNRYDYDGFRPWDETYRGISGWDSHGRGYYFASGIPEVGAQHWGSKGYGGIRDDRDRYGGGGGGTSGGGGGGGGGYYRPRDPYDGYRSTNYLYERPSSSTTNRPPNSGDNASDATQSPQDNTSG